MPDERNFVAEWFGHRVYPSVSSTPNALEDQKLQRCPFLSKALHRPTRCIKSEASLGVCTISSNSNGMRQDWLVCPYRVVESQLEADVVDHIFGSDSSRLIVAAPRLEDADERERVRNALTAGKSVVVYFQDTLGGEISISRTARSPELAFDITLAEIKPLEGHPAISRYGIFEIQTMDFHGSYKHAVTNLEDALRLHESRFADAVRENPRWLCERIEGPNIANVFKRTFYQMILKFGIGAMPYCAGSVLALPESVWDSWQRHLGAPTLTPRRNGDLELGIPNVSLSDPPSAWIYVFDIDSTDSISPNRIVIRKRIATDADAISYFALKVAPEAAIGKEGSAIRVPESLRRRLRNFWPDLWELSLEAP